jgi:hypothetical protein
MQKRISFKINKGAKFALQVVKEETDLTAEMIARFVGPSDIVCLKYFLLICHSRQQRSLEDTEVQALQLCSAGRPYS